MNTEEKIHEVITPTKNLFDVDLREIWDYRDLLVLFVRRDFVSSYKQTILGPVWFFIQPIFTTLMFVIIFGKIASISTDGIPPILFYMCGITCWNYFADCLNKTSNTFTANASIFGKVYFPRLILPLSIVVSNLIKFVIQFMLFLSFYCYYLYVESDIEPNIYLVLIPVLVLIMAGLGLGFGILISSLTTKYRDFQFLVLFGVQLFMYATPIVYPLSLAQEKLGSYAWVAEINPMTSVIETFKFALLNKGQFDWNMLCYSFVFMTLLLVIGVVTFNKVEQNFMDTV